MKITDADVERCCAAFYPNWARYSLSYRMAKHTRWARALRAVFDAGARGGTRITVGAYSLPPNGASTREVQDEAHRAIDTAIARRRHDDARRRDDDTSDDRPRDESSTPFFPVV